MWSSIPQTSVGKLDDSYDFVIAGGGNAGCVLARRLSESGRFRVLLVEKGDSGDSWLHRAPLASLHHFSDGKHSTVFESAADERFGRTFPIITGLGLGGSTRVNGGQYTPGAPCQYNAWAAAGNKGWGYGDLKPYFLRSETWNGPSPQDWHGKEGPLQVRAFEDYLYPPSKRAAQAISQLGYPSVLDMHSPMGPSIGWNKMQYILGMDGTRQSSFRAYLPKTFVASRSDGLHVCTKAIVGRVFFENLNQNKLRAGSAEILQVDGRRTQIVKAKYEIILACGALETPKLLLLSGIGHEDELEKLGVEVVQHLPGVGAHLQDHAWVATSYYCALSDSLWSMFRRPQTFFSQLFKYLRYGTGWMLCTTVETEIFGHSSLIRPDGTLDAAAVRQRLDSTDPKNLPDFGVMTCGIADPTGAGVDRSRGFFGMNCVVMSATSQGRVSLLSRDPMQNPRCELNFLSSPEDRAVLRAALRASAAVVREVRAGGYQLDDLKVPKALDEASLDEFIDAHVNTMFHYTSTCRMAPPDDPQPGVVDDELRVHGVSNLRIADASVFPDVPATHPQALVYAVAEKCADMVLRLHSIS